MTCNRDQVSKLSQTKDIDNTSTNFNTYISF